MSSLLQKLKLGTANVKIICWPGSEQKIALKILSQQDHQEAAFACDRHFTQQKIAISMVTADEYDVEKSMQVLYRALRNPESLDEPIATTMTEFRAAITREEKNKLIEEYLAFETDVSPQGDRMSGDEFDALVASLKKNPQQSVGSISSLSTLRRLCAFMASQPLTLPAVNG